MSIATRTGDQGKTSLLYGRRVDKFDARVEACGAVDELNAALGLARAQAAPRLVKVELPRIQKELVALMGGLAVAPEDRDRYAQDKFMKLTPEMLAGLDELVARLEGAENQLRRLGDAGRERFLRGAGRGPHGLPAGGAQRGATGRGGHDGRAGAALPEPAFRRALADGAALRRAYFPHWTVMSSAPSFSGSRL